MAKKTDWRYPDEEWRRAPTLKLGNRKVNYGHHYAVSNFGRVMRLIPGERTFKGRILKATKRADGRPVVSLCRDGKPRKTYVNQLVCLAFHGPAPHEGALVAHLDGDPGNNRAANLRWETKSDVTTRVAQRHVVQEKSA